MNETKLGPAFALALLMALTSARGNASLGGKEVSIRHDALKLRGNVSVSPQDHYTVHSIESGGTNVREYALPDGTVFAVTWRGISQPDLSVLLGSYYPEFKAGASRSSANRGRRPHALRTRRLVVERSGHMRDVRGRAYVPALLPEGVDPEDLS